VVICLILKIVDISGGIASVPQTTSNITRDSSWQPWNQSSSGSVPYSMGSEFPSYTGSFGLSGLDHSTLYVEKGRLDYEENDTSLGNLSKMNVDESFPEWWCDKNQPLLPAAVSMARDFSNSPVRGMRGPPAMQRVPLGGVSTGD
jgi:hypothetical protein